MRAFWIASMVIFSLGLVGSVGAHDDTVCVRTFEQDAGKLAERYGDQFVSHTCSGALSCKLCLRPSGSSIRIPRALLTCFIAEFNDHRARLLSVALNVGNELHHDGTAQVTCRGQAWTVELVE